MTDAATPAAMHVRLMRYLPRDLAAGVSPKHVASLVQTAWDNNWRDPEWLARVALQGTGMANVTNAAAMFTAQLRDAANTECPLESTPVPPPVRTADPHYSGPPTPCPPDVAARMRADIDAAKRQATTKETA